MTEEEARKAAERIVYCDYDKYDIIRNCEREGIAVYKKNGRMRNRDDMESDLIEAYIKKWTTK